MTRRLLLASLRHLAAALFFAALALLSFIHDLAAELGDEVRASRRENYQRQHPEWRPARVVPSAAHSGHFFRRGIVQKNIKLTDIVSLHRSRNALHAALVGDSTRARATLSDARQLAAELAMVRRAS
jgi:hypothetical protein